MMALEWVRRRPFRYDMWLPQRDKDYVYTATDVAAYEEDLEWVSLTCDVPCDSPTRQFG